MQKLLSYLTEYPVLSAVTVVFIVAILYITVVGFWPFTKASGVSGLRSFCKKVEQLKKQIEEAAKKLPKEKTVERQREKFTNKYHEIDAWFKRDQSIFSHIWLEFTEQLIKPSGKEPFYKNSIRPEKFFTLEYFLKQKNINLKLVESMPGILLGIGVLGTFSGLSISLLMALPDLISDGPQEALNDLVSDGPKEALNDLIGGSAVAFITSVAGLFCSLIFNVVSDKKRSLLQIELNTFNTILEKSLKFITEEHLLTKYLEELQQQAKHLSNMDENIALKIGDVMENSIDKMGGKIQEVILKNNQNISEKFLESITDQMTKGMGDFSRKQMENMEKTLSSLQENIPPLVSRLEDSQKQNEMTTKSLINKLASAGRESQKQINESLIHAVQNMKGEFKEITQNLKEGMNQTLSDSSKELKDLLSNVFEKNNMLLKEAAESKKSFQNDIDQTVDKLHVFANHLNKIIFEFNDAAVPKIQSSFEKFNTAMEQQKQIAEKNGRYIHSLDDLSESLKTMSSSVSETMGKLPSFISQINQSNEALEKIWGAYEKRFSQVDESTKKLFENISEGLHSLSKGSAEYIHNLYQQSSQVSNNFATAVEELKESLSEGSSSLSKEKEEINNSYKQFFQVSNNFAATVKELSEIVNKIYSGSNGKQSSSTGQGGSSIPKKDNEKWKKPA